MCYLNIVLRNTDYDYMLFPSRKSFLDSIVIDILHMVQMPVSAMLLLDLQFAIN